MTTVHINANASSSSVVDVSGEKLEITPLGAGNEVGRSAIIVKYRGKTVMFDCGVHPAYNGMASLPFFDEIDPKTVDLVLVTHFHLDHCGAVPYFLEKTTFKGRVFMTHPTKAIYKMLLSDFVKVSNVAAEDMLFDENDLNKSLEKIEPIDYHQEVEHNGIRFWCYNAGHVLGAAMFMIEIAGVKVLYTGDFSRHSDRHLLGAETPVVSPDVVIVESTYGIKIHEPRRDRENLFTKYVANIVKRGGRCLLPVFALGRAQELLLILDEYWEAHPELHKIPIYYASSLAKKCMKVFQTYINMMNQRIRTQFEISNPFVFKHITNLKGREHLDDSGPCVVMASPGMLQSGLSNELFESWCTDKRNGVVITGYCVDGTLAKYIMNEPNEVTLTSGETVPLNLSVHYISFSAHSDFAQTSEFIDATLPSHIVLVHGDPSNMSRLKQALLQRYEGHNIQVHTPKNCDPVKLVFRGEKMAKVVGQLAANAPPYQGNLIKGLLVHKDFQQHLMSPEDLQLYAELQATKITQRILVPLPQVREKNWIQKCLEALFQPVVGTTTESVNQQDAMKTEPANGESKADAREKEVEPKSSTNADQQLVYRVGNTVSITLNTGDAETATEATIEFKSSTADNILVDAILSSLLERSLVEDTVKQEQSTVKETTSSTTTDEDADDAMDVEAAALLASGSGNNYAFAAPYNETVILRTMQDMLIEHFGSEVVLDFGAQQFQFSVDGNKAIIDFSQQQSTSSTGMKILCESPDIIDRLRITMRRVFFSLYPIPCVWD